MNGTIDARTQRWIAQPFRLPGTAKFLWQAEQAKGRTVV
jgi:hypothetical protein